MALDAGIDARLRRWAEGCTVGNGSGYSTMSVLHSNWQPPMPGSSPTMKTFLVSDVLETDRAVRRMAPRYRRLLAVVYTSRLSREEQATLLDCKPATLTLRLGRAHAWLRSWLAGDE